MMGSSRDTNRDSHDTMIFHILLGISLLKQSTPELIVILGVNEDELSIVRRESVIDHYIHPLAKMPESEMENACISITPTLFLGYNLIGEMNSHSK